MEPGVAVRKSGMTVDEARALGNGEKDITSTTTPIRTQQQQQWKQSVLAVVLCGVWTSAIGLVSSLSNYYAHQNVWNGVAKSGDDQFWCERDYSDMLIREPSNSWSDFSFFAVGLVMIFVGLSDMFLRNKKNKSQNLFIEYPSLSIINGFANIFHAFGTFSNHSCRCWNGYQMDVTGMYLVILFPLSYNLIHLYLHRYHHHNHLLLLHHNDKKVKVNIDVAVMVKCMLYFGAGLVFFFTTYVDIDPGLIVLPLVVGILISTLKVKENSKKFQVKYHTPLFNGAIAMLGIGYLCWLLDRHKVVCFPHSTFQLHAVWHIATAISLVCVYLYQRSENHHHIRAVFDLQSCFVMK